MINEAVLENNLALLIRIEDGQPPQGGPVSADAPYFLMVNASVIATNWDSRYQSLADAIAALGKAITNSIPGDAASLQNVSQAGAQIGSICAGISLALGNSAAANIGELSKAPWDTAATD